MQLLHHCRPVTPNIGNDLIVQATLALVREAAGRPLDVISMPAKGVTSVIKRGGLNSQSVHDINEMASGLLIGPGNLFENGGLDVDPVALASLRVKPLLFSVSWGRIFDDRGELHPRTDSMRGELIAALCRQSAAVLVRDHVTKRHLESLGFDEARVVGCPVLALRPAEIDGSAPDERAEGAALVSVRSPNLMNVSPRLQGRVHEDVRRIIDGLRALGHRKVALVCHDPRDLRFAASFADVPVLYTESPQQFLGWLRSCDISLSFRLHSFLPCAVLGTPSIHFTYDERAIGLVEVAGLGACDVDYVRRPDPVRDALELAAEPASLTHAVEAARPGWLPLRTAMLDGISTWLRGVHERG